MPKTDPNRISNRFPRVLRTQEEMAADRSSCRATSRKKLRARLACSIAHHPPSMLYALYLRFTKHRRSPVPNPDVMTRNQPTENRMSGIPIEASRLHRAACPGCQGQTEPEWGRGSKPDDSSLEAPGERAVSGTDPLGSTANLSIAQEVSRSK
ncbi:uncharacterized protein BO72DRAFT_281623 [Aspergillus fijiensis CBS 313.89]|uniref:Uncharacterized protein n=1 Tax=Aspergillus fijiensis CBS 313.89 TaxID=1448319 RepID=A0A8G1W132_9EURO|nr:uncharacterized protein BO72DRAFT_281623 [Aspergillus fijiensis CBS 313.89]RAK80505.1 hypothetical protein BO72DRAFT_281623 [Aspergillus fijiensis CBS 313.89]